MAFASRRIPSRSSSSPVAFHSSSRGLITRACHGAALPRLRQGGDNVRTPWWSASPSCCRFRYEATTTSAAVTACSVTPICSYAESRGTQGGSDLEGRRLLDGASWVAAWLAIRRFAATSAAAELFPDRLRRNSTRRTTSGIGCCPGHRSRPRKPESSAVTPRFPAAQGGQGEVRDTFSLIPRVRTAMRAFTDVGAPQHRDPQRNRIRTLPTLGRRGGGRRGLDRRACRRCIVVRSWSAASFSTRSRPEGSSALEHPKQGILDLVRGPAPRRRNAPRSALDLAGEVQGGLPCREALPRSITRSRYWFLAACGGVQAPAGSNPRRRNPSRRPPW